MLRSAAAVWGPRRGRRVVVPIQPSRNRALLSEGMNRFKFREWIAGHSEGGRPLWGLLLRSRQGQSDLRRELVAPQDSVRQIISRITQAACGAASAEADQDRDVVRCTIADLRRQATRCSPATHLVLLRGWRGRGCGRGCWRFQIVRPAG